MIVSIIGRPNVGKSTLFNRISGERISIVSSISGTTRDRISINTNWNDKNFILIDTGGIDNKSKNKFQFSITEQVLIAVKDSDKLIFMVDGKEGLNPLDYEVVDLIRKNEKNAIVAINKMDLPNNDKTFEFQRLGNFDSVEISAYHNRGITDLLDKVLDNETTVNNPVNNEIKLSIVGHPNVGKSTIFNVITNSQRSIVSDIPGTTRDSIDTNISYQNKTIKFIDTAGLRKRGQIEKGIEKYSTIRTLKSLENSDVSLLILSAEKLITSQDLHISGFIKDLFRPCVIVLNKIDLIEQEILQNIKMKLKKNLNISPTSL